MLPDDIVIILLNIPIPYIDELIGLVCENTILSNSLMLC